MLKESMKRRRDNVKSMILSLHSVQEEIENQDAIAISKMADSVAPITEMEDVEVEEELDQMRIDSIDETDATFDL